MPFHFYLFLSAEPIPKPRLNVTLSSSSTEETKKKRPVPQPRSLVSKSTSVSKLFSMSSEVQPVPSVNVKIFKRYSRPSSVSSMQDPPLPLGPPPPPPGGLTHSSSSSSGEEGDFPPVLPARRPSTSHSHKSSVPYYVSDVQDHQK